MMFLSRRDEQSNATRDALITAATELFGSDGYHGTGVEDIARAARVTRGALYHHFDDKRSLFDAVVVALQTEVAVFVESKARQQDDKWIRERSIWWGQALSWRVASLAVKPGYQRSKS